MLYLEHCIIPINNSNIQIFSKNNFYISIVLKIFLENGTFALSKATNPAPSLHITVGLNFLFLNFESIIQKSGNAFR